MFLDKRIGIICVQSSNIFFETQTKYREFDSELKHFWYDVYRTDRRRSARLLHARILMPERRKRAAVAAATSAALASSAALTAVKALVLLLQSIDLGRVHFSCAFFLYSTSRVGVYIVATANVACLLLDVIYQSRDPRNNGLVHRRQRHTNKVTCTSILDEQLHNSDTFYIFYYSLTTHIMIKSKKFFAQKVVLFFRNLIFLTFK